LDHNRRKEILEFKNLKDYGAWEEAMQKKTFSFYSKHRGEFISKKTNSVYSYKYCQLKVETNKHTHKRKTHTKNGKATRKTDRKRKCGLVPVENCPSKLIIRANSSSVKVEFYPEHNHAQNSEIIKFQPLPRSVGFLINCMIFQGIDAKRILAECEDEKFVRTRREDDLVIYKSDHVSYR